MVKIKHFIKNNFKRAFSFFVSVIIFSTFLIVPVFADTYRLSTKNLTPDQLRIYAYNDSNFTTESGIVSSENNIYMTWGTISSSAYPKYLTQFTTPNNLDIPAGQVFNVSIPYRFNNNGVYADGSPIRLYISRITIYFKIKDGTHDTDDELPYSWSAGYDLPLNYTNVRYGSFKIDVSVSCPYDISSLWTIDCEVKSYEGEGFYKTTWGADGMRAAYGFDGDIVITTGNDVPKYTAPDDTSVDMHNDLENTINNANKVGLNDTGAMFSGIGNMVNNGSSIGKGLLAVTKIFTNAGEIPIFKNLLMFGLVLGMFAFLVGMSSLITGAHRNHVQKNKKGKGS